jgi:hypothetical protein
LSSGGKIVAPRFETFATISAISDQTRCNIIGAKKKDRQCGGLSEIQSDLRQGNRRTIPIIET